jgi:hypothetical protein
VKTDIVPLLPDTGPEAAEQWLRTEIDSGEVAAVVVMTILKNGQNSYGMFGRAESRDLYYLHKVLDILDDDETVGHSR